MVVAIPQIIAAINPDLYYDTGESIGSFEHKKKLKEFKFLIKEKGAYAAAVKAKTREESIHKLIYDSPTETLEPVYFYLLDLMNEFGLKTEKLIDNFTSSPGSQHFGEMGQRVSIMQQQGAKLMGDINTVLRSIINLIYDLREFKIRLQAYKDLETPNKKDQAILSLKQVWMDKVDINKGNSSIKAMALGQAGFTTLLDAFLAVNSSQDIDKLDLNDIVKRILKPRIHEFNIWIKESEAELKKRFEIEKTYLKSQVNSLKIYSRWAKPYMKAAQDLEAGDRGRNPSLVKMFNSLVLDLTLLGKRKVDSTFPHTKRYKQKRDYFLVVLVDFNFRGIPNRTQQGYVMGGRAEVTFRSYALNSEELDRLDEELNKSDLSDALCLIEGATTESLGTLEKDIKEFVDDYEDKKEKKVEKSKSGSNPFLALIGYYNQDEKKVENKGNKKSKEINPDDWIEKNYIRAPAIVEAKQTNYSIFDIYKKSHGMPSSPINPYDVFTFSKA